MFVKDMLVIPIFTVTFEFTSTRVKIFNVFRSLLFDRMLNHWFVWAKLVLKHFLFSIKKLDFMKEMERYEKIEEGK